MGRRLLGFLVDAVAALAVNYAVMFGAVALARTGGGFGPVEAALVVVISALLVAAYHVVPTWLAGRTLGKWIAGTLVISVRTGSTPGPGAAVVRFLVFALCMAVFPVMLLVALVSMGTGRMRALWDSAGGTCVIRLPAQHP
ncbi:RDD family protein [Murinocardiopsis flavida]|nr:RDD family protein [Murinocardiopsis flavida]